MEEWYRGGPYPYHLDPNMAPYFTPYYYPSPASGSSSTSSSGAGVRGVPIFRPIFVP
jgi:hypothetical protein